MISKYLNFKKLMKVTLTIDQTLGGNKSFGLIIYERVHIWKCLYKNLFIKYHSLCDLFNHTHYYFMNTRLT